ncbi:hypothetical protein KL916_000521 [Ogataea parapolymorpha]|nr:hypothetical protein KL916_000521 [Ogataea parapolymorpha]
MNYILEYVTQALMSVARNYTTRVIKPPVIYANGRSRPSGNPNLKSNRQSQRRPHLTGFVESQSSIRAFI